MCRFLASVARSTQNMSHFDLLQGAFVRQSPGTDKQKFEHDASKAHREARHFRHAVCTPTRSVTVKLVYLIVVFQAHWSETHQPEEHPTDRRLPVLLITFSFRAKRSSNWPKPLMPVC